MDPLPGAGVDGIHAISGTCDLCGDTVDPNTQELNVLGCTFKQCESLPYHQDCLEKVSECSCSQANYKLADPAAVKQESDMPVHHLDEALGNTNSPSVPQQLQVCQAAKCVC
jgi:hypothetical protein